MAAACRTKTGAGMCQTFHHITREGSSKYNVLLYNLVGAAASGLLLAAASQ
jgi:citrate lyase alpha subunit